MSNGETITRIRDVMKTGVDIVDGMMTVSAVLAGLKHPENRAIFVDKRNADDEYGVVMFRDIAREIIARRLNPERVNVYEIMSKPVIGVDPDMNIRYCIRLLDRFGLSRVPVIEAGRIIGIVSYSDIVLKGMGLIPAASLPETVAT